MRALHLIRVGLPVLALAPLFSNPACAEVVIEWRTIGDAENPEDPANSASLPGIGTVEYVYRMGTYEVTNEQYAEFLNAVARTDTHGLYHVSMATNPRGGIFRNGIPGSYEYNFKPNMARKPVNFVTYLSAMRFVNWLHNGQPSGPQGPGTTEDGAYVIINGIVEVRAKGAKYFIPSQNEWYKAAYYQPASAGGDGDHYWLYATASNDVPTPAAATECGDLNGTGDNAANYDSSADWGAQNGNVSSVGTAGGRSRSFYGTADQAGNVWEWTEAVSSGLFRVLRGASYNRNATFLQSSTTFQLTPNNAISDVGFRVAAVAPSPSADLDGDGDVDLLDFAAFQSQYTGP